MLKLYLKAEYAINAVRRLIQSHAKSMLIPSLSSGF